MPNALYEDAAPPGPAEIALHSPLCELLGCRYPLILAGMGGVARSELVIAVTRAGAFGFLGMVREPPALIRAEVARVRAATQRPFGVNLIPSATDPELLARQVELCIELRVPVVSLFWDVYPDLIDRLLRAGIVVVHQVGSIADAHRAQEAGAAALIVQGVEAGGHVRGLLPLAELLPGVLAVAGVPVAAAGGIVDGRDVARVLLYGAQAAVLGTAMVATQESFAHEYHKQRLVAARSEDTVLTGQFHINWPPRARVRVLVNSVTRGERGDAFAAAPDAGPAIIGEDDGRPIRLFSTDSPLRSTSGDLEAMALYAGEGVGRIHGIEAAARRIARIASEAAVQIQLANPGAGRASPVCYAHEFAADPQAEVLARLNELLEAERAGARVTLRSTGALPDEALRHAVEIIHHDEVRWCAMLIHAIRSLQATPSTRTGAFYDKAIAITDPLERMSLLNRGQAWVVRKINELLPMLDDEAIRAGLVEMLAAHQINIDLVESLLETKRRPRSRGAPPPRAC